MGLFDNVSKRYTAMKVGLSIMGEGLGWKAPGRPGGLLSALQQALTPRYADPPKRGTEHWLKMFGKNPRLSPAYKISQDVASTRWSLKRKGDNVEIEKHPVIDLFRKPNPLPETTWFNLLFMTEAYLLVRGEAFWIKERNGLRVPTELWIVPPNWVMETPSLYRPFFRIQIKDGRYLEVPIEDMVYFKEPDLSDPYGRGQGRAEGIEDEIETDEYMAKWAKKFFFNDAKPPLVVTAPGAQKTDVERMEEKWIEKVGGGLKNAHKPAFLPFDGKVIELGKSQKDMDFIESRRFIRDLANQHFNVPPELLGIIENSNRATIDAADYIYRSGTLTTRLSMIKDVIQQQLIEADFGTDLCFEFENVIPEDKEFKLKSSTEGVKVGTVMLDEWRQCNGMDPYEVKKGQVMLIPNTHTPTDDPLAMQAKKDSIAEQAANRPVPNPNEPNGKKPPKPGQPAQQGGNAPKGFNKSFEKIKALTPEQKAQIAGIFDNAAEQEEKKLTAALRRFFERQGKRAESRIGSLLKNYVPAVTKADDADGQAEELVARLLVWDDEQKKMVEVLTPYWISSAKAGNGVADEQFELSIDFDLLNPDMLEWIETEGGNHVKGITETTKDNLRRTLSAGIAAGEGVDKLAARVRDSFEEAGRYRSYMIARTETHGSLVRGAFLTYDTAGIDMKQWLAVNDERTRDSHKRVNMEKRKMHELFSNGCEYPGSGPADEVIHCRCALLPVIGEVGGDE